MSKKSSENQKKKDLDIKSMRQSSVIGKPKTE